MRKQLFFDYITKYEKMPQLIFKFCLNTLNLHWKNVSGEKIVFYEE